MLRNLEPCRQTSLMAAKLSVTLFCFPQLAVAAEESGISSTFLLVYAVGLVLLSVAIILGLTRWGSKQDQIQSMMPFCIRYLVESSNEHEKIEAAKALGKAKDPGALLILVDIINNVDTSDALKSVSVDALRTMSKKYSRYGEVINKLLEASEQQDHQRTIDLLTRHFERSEKSYVQSAYVIGREYERTEEYSEARTWLQQAHNRNLKAKVYDEQISTLIDRCNQHLFHEGDVLFKVEEYYDALERYALASHDLGLADKHRYEAHLRLACTYCKLERYEDAYQETLHALHDEAPSEESVELNRILQNIRSEIGSTTEAKSRRQELVERTNELISTIFMQLK